MREISDRQLLGTLAKLAQIDNPTFDGDRLVINKQQAQQLIDSGVFAELQWLQEFINDPARVSLSFRLHMDDGPILHQVRLHGS